MKRILRAVIAVPLLSLIACADIADDGEAQISTEVSVVDPSPTGEPRVPGSGCSIVQFCNAPGPDGTRCVQQGCSLSTAMSECDREAHLICGTPVQPWIFVCKNPGCQ